jgi:hypothetical protein
MDREDKTCRKMAGIGSDCPKTTKSLSTLQVPGDVMKRAHAEMKRIIMTISGDYERPL